MQYKVYFNEYNVRMGDFSYLPLVSGLLQSYSETFPLIKENFQFMPYIYEMAQSSKILANYTEKPDIAAFSSVMWNEQLNYHIAKTIKERYPECIIIFGGPNVPMPPQHDISDWMKKHSFVDVAVRAEGEEPFADFLKRFLDTKSDFRDISGLAFREKNGEISFSNNTREFKRDLSEYPSPYLEGLYDNLLKSSLKWQAIIETNRGCPFPCAFCYWGRGGLSRKYKYHNMDRVFAEIDWMGRNGIKYVFNADSNFGMNDRDQEIAEHIVATKQKYGFPEKFRTCFGKNTDEKIFKIGALFHRNQLEKGITLARQSNDELTLKNIRRQNIKMETYRNLQKLFNDQDIPVYGELILGLPGETVTSWKRGVDELLEAGTKNQLFIYLCQIFSNTEMAEDEYRKKFQIQTSRIPLTEIHGGLRPDDWVTEYEDVVISTYSMTVEEWKKMLKFSYVLMLFHSLKISYYVMIFLLDKWNIKMSEFIDFVSEEKFKSPAEKLRNELKFYDSIINGIIQGKHRGTILPEYGDLYWDVEEVSFLRLTQNKNGFYFNELTSIVYEFLKSKSIEFNSEEELLLNEIIAYQAYRIPDQSQVQTVKLTDFTDFVFGWNIGEYFDKRFTTNRVDLTKTKELFSIKPETYEDLKTFARKTILWGRKSGTMLVQCVYNRENLN